MHVRRLHPWRLAPRDAAALQARLAPQVIAVGDPALVRLVAACDVAFSDRPSGRRPSLARAAVVLVSYPALELVDSYVVEAPMPFPYVPGLLSFREAPVLATAFEAAPRPDLLLVDGHGRAHPRRFGIASHLGLLLDVPAIGVAKSRLTGEHADPAPERGASAPLVDGGETIGAALRTRDGVRPVYVSAGHRISLDAAVAWTLRLCTRYRLPEPIRLADHLSKRPPSTSFLP